MSNITGQIYNFIMPWPANFNDPDGMTSLRYEGEERNALLAMKVHLDNLFSGEIAKREAAAKIRAVHTYIEGVDSDGVPRLVTKVVPSSVILKKLEELYSETVPLG